MPLARLLMTSSLIGSVPPLPRMRSITPCQASSPARVTTKEGRPTLVMIVPWRRPTAAVLRSAARIAAHHGHPVLRCTSSAATMPPMPATKPIERSISPSSRANTSPIASSMKTAPCTSRLTRLPAERNCGFAIWKMMQMTTRLAATGRRPLSPALIRATQARRYSPRELARISGATA